MGWKTHSTNIVFIYCIFDFILQTLPDSHESYVLYGSTQAEFCTSQNWVFIWSMIRVFYIYIYIYVCIYMWESIWNPDSSTLESDQPQHEGSPPMLSPGNVCCHIHVIALSVLEGKIWHAVQKSCFNFHLLF
jgi:hypothetical protein